MYYILETLNNNFFNFGMIYKLLKRAEILQNGYPKIKELLLIVKR